MKKILALALTFLFVVSFMIGCGTSDKITFYTTMHNILNLDTNAYDIEINIVSDDVETFGKLKEYAYLFKNSKEQYILNIKINGERSSDDQLSSADIYYKIADMNDYSMLTDVVLEESILYINAQTLVKAFGEIVPEYKEALNTYYVSDSKYLKMELSKYYKEDLNLVAKAAGKQGINFIEATFTNMDIPITKKEGDSYILEINKSNIDAVLSNLVLSIKEIEPFYDEFLEELENNKDIESTVTEDYKNYKNEFLTKCAQKVVEIQSSNEKVEKFKNENTKVVLQASVNDNESGRIQYSKKEESGNYFIINYQTSNKDVKIMIPEGVSDFDLSMYSFLSSIYSNNIYNSVW